MSQRFHVTPKGQVRQCKAVGGGCPYGVEDHADSREAAEKRRDEKMRVEHGSGLASVSSSYKKIQEDYDFVENVLHREGIHSDNYFFRRRSSYRKHVKKILDRLHEEMEEGEKLQDFHDSAPWRIVEISDAIVSEELENNDRAFKILESRNLGWTPLMTNLEPDEARTLVEAYPDARYGLESLSGEEIMRKLGRLRQKSLFNGIYVDKITGFSPIVTDDDEAFVITKIKIQDRTLLEDYNEFYAQKQSRLKNRSISEEGSIDRAALLAVCHSSKELSDILKNDKNVKVSREPGSIVLTWDID